MHQSCIDFFMVTISGDGKVVPLVAANHGDVNTKLMSSMHLVSCVLLLLNDSRLHIFVSYWC